MSEHHSRTDAALFDRLVDGELDPRSQAEFLARLDERPGDWRRLALAFVEAQTLGVELRDMAAEARRPPLPVARPPAASVATTTEAGTPWARFLTLAATMLLAVGIGFGVGRVWSVRGSQAGNKPMPPDQPLVAENDPNERAVGPSIPVVPASRGGLSPQGVMTVRTADGSPVQLPVYEPSPEANPFLTSSESSVPPEVIRALRSRGHDVQQQRRLWPVDLGDGRQIIVPVDQVDVQYVGNRAYQ